MATVTLTARYLDQLKSHVETVRGVRRDRAGTGDPHFGRGPQNVHVVLPPPRPDAAVGLGRYPDVLLEKARKIATQHRGRIFDGADPASEKQTEHAQDDNTVQALYELYRSRKEKVLRSWSKSAASWRRKSCRPGGIGGSRISAP